MRRHLLDLVILFVFATSSLGLRRARAAERRGVALHAYVVVVGGLLLLALVAAAGRRRADGGAALELRRALADRSRREPSLHELERCDARSTLADGTALRPPRAGCCRPARRSPRRASSGPADAPGPETLGPLVGAPAPRPADRRATASRRGHQPDRAARTRRRP